jgi:hypothetical protein
MAGDGQKGNSERLPRTAVGAGVNDAARSMVFREGAQPEKRRHNRGSDESHFGR